MCCVENGIYLRPHSIAYDNAAQRYSEELVFFIYTVLVYNFTKIQFSMFPERASDLEEFDMYLIAHFLEYLS